jgi:hypothetical protein
MGAMVISARPVELAWLFGVSALAVVAHAVMRRAGRAIG